MYAVTTTAHSTGSTSEGSTSGFSGNVLALMSAAASGVYMVLLPVTVPDKSTDMPSLFGMIGFTAYREGLEPCTLLYSVPCMWMIGFTAYREGLEPHPTNEPLLWIPSH